MADAPDKESKTEEATEKKIRDSVEKGQLPFSKDTPVFASFVAFLLFTLFFAYDTSVRLGGFLSTFIERPEAWTLVNNADAIALYRIVFIEIAKAVMVVLAMIVAFGIGASVLQNTPRLVGDRVTPKFSRISPRQGWTRLFGAQGMVEFGKAVAKMVFASTFLVFVMRDAPSRLLSGMATNPAAFTAAVVEIAVEVLVTMAIVMAAIAAADLVWSRFHWKHDLRMTRQEVKDELKQTDGDPVVKSRMRSLARDRARRRMIAAVPQATLIIANPTHFSIALRYRRDKDAAPVVVAKGQDLLALRIREIAAEHDIPVFENVALARSMYSQVSVDSMIPPQFYQAVAELIRIIYGTDGRATRGARPA
jgi:flagellar biosynthesis protein FlhB